MRVSLILTVALVIPLSQPQFEPVQPELFGAGSALTNAWADYDADGDLDLFVGFNGTPNRLYRNDAGRFSDAAAVAGVADARATRAAAWGDFDRDGDPDLLVGFAPGNASVLKLYRNDRGRFVDHTIPAGLSVDSGAVRQPTWIDYDDDGDIDLFVALRDRPNLLFQNDGGKFTNVAASVGLADPRRSVGAVWFDFERDGDLDLYVANMDGDANGLFRNHQGRFTDVAATAGAAWGGRASDPTNGTVRPCLADVDGDGLLDLFLANYGRNGLLLNLGDTFEDVSERWGIAVDARFDTCAPADFDHDGRIDLYVNGTITSGVSHPDYLYRNTGLKLEEVTPVNVRLLQASHGAQWADFDADGDLDLALAGTAPGATHSLLRNQLPADGLNRSLQIRVLDEAGHSVRAGTEVRVYGAGSTLIGTRIVDTGSGYNSQNDAPVHFGLGNAQLVTVEITTPRRGERRVARIGAVDSRKYAGKVLRVQVDDRGRARVITQ